MNPPSRRAMPPILLSAALLVLVLATLVLTLKTTDVNVEATAGIAMELPARIGEWVGEDASVAQIERDYLGADTKFARKIYRDPRGREIFLGLVLSGRDRSSIHAAEACLIGQGWTIQDGQILRIAMDSPKPYPLDMMRLAITRTARAPDGRPVTVRNWYCYWFVGKNRLTPRHLNRILWTAFDRIFFNVHHRWAYVALIVNPPPGREKETEDMLKEFIRKAVPTFQKTTG
ncbi:MAG: EpsI family protein [Verrucomicrobiae bacterium]|nr:EpsI family protein [Verrucomicrobiae bacterium]